jgi:twitching motility two-component system response regulator PilG
MHENSILKSVLIVDDDRDFLICLENFLKVYTDQIDVLIAANGLQALQILENRKVDLLVTDIKMPEMDGIELLSRLSLKKLDLNVIVTTAFATKENIARLNKIGQFYYLPKPFSLEIFGKKILGALKEKSEAFVSQFTLTNLLQLIDMEQKTCTLQVKSNGKIGYLYLQKGALINAATNGVEGAEAAKTIISWGNAQTEIQGTCRTERKIHTPLMSILLEATRFADENRVSQANTDSLEKAVELAEGRHFTEAKTILAQLLKNDNRNAKAWLWFSRVVENVKSIKVTLTNAAKIAPEDPEIAAEFEKFNRIISQLKDEHFHRCPFCWSPFKKGSYQCPNCGGHLTVYDGLLKSAPAGNKGVLKQTVERLNRAISREKNAKAHYYLGLAHLNLANWEDALTHLDKSAKLDPANKSYGYQLQTLLNHIASAKADPAVGIPSRQKESNHSRTAQESPVKRKKILVVEDSSTIRKVISVTLSQSGYEIIEAGDGLEALSKLNESSPDLILLDIILPKMDGYKILSIIKENPDLCHIPVIMLTSKDGILNKVKGKMAGSAAYLTKPFDPSQLVETIERHLK